MSLTAHRNYLILLSLLFIWGCSPESKYDENGINKDGLLVDGRPKPAFYLKVDTKNFNVQFGIDDSNRLINVIVNAKSDEDTLHVLSRFEPIELSSPSLRRIDDIVYLDLKDSGEFVPYLSISDELIVLSENEEKAISYSLSKYMKTED